MDSQSETFPQEILDLIIKQLDPETDLQSLKFCSSTSWSLLLPARRLIFRRTLLNQGSDYFKGNVKKYDKIKGKLDALVQLIERDPARSSTREGYPTVASCIRYLDLQLALTHPNRPRSASAVNDSQRMWNEINSRLPDLLGMLHNVERLNLHFHNSHCSCQCDWQLIDTSITNSLLRFLSSQSLTAVSFASIHGLPIAALLHCSNLQEVNFKNVSGQREQPFFARSRFILSDLNYPDPALRLEWAIETACPPPTLKICCLTNSPFALRALINLPDRQRALLFRDLQELRQDDTTSFSFEQQLVLLNLVSRTLRILRLRCGMNGQPAGPFDKIDLACFSNLHTIDLSFLEEPDLDDRTSCYPYFLHILKKPTPATIQKVVIEFAWKRVTESLEDWILAQTVWIDSELVEILSGRLYPNLKKVVVKLGFWYEGGEYDSESELLEIVNAAAGRVNGRLDGMFPKLRFWGHTTPAIEIEVGANFKMMP